MKIDWDFISATLTGTFCFMAFFGGLFWFLHNVTPDEICHEKVVKICEAVPRGHYDQSEYAPKFEAFFLGNFKEKE